jgi:hypothetical protein
MRETRKQTWRTLLSSLQPSSKGRWPHSLSVQLLLGQAGLFEQLLLGQAGPSVQLFLGPAIGDVHGLPPVNTGRSLAREQFYLFCRPFVHQVI